MPTQTAKENSPPEPSMALVQMVDLKALHRQVERLTAMLEASGVDSPSTETYVEPGPGSPRQYFSAAELAERWGWGDSKIYALTDAELPRFKHGQLVRYHWTHVWAFEGKISWDTAQSIFEADAI